MQFNDLYCLARPEIHTLSLGAAKALDFSGVGMVIVERWPPLPKSRPEIALDSR
jgi:hypothetical protein